MSDRVVRKPSNCPQARTPTRPVLLGLALIGCAFTARARAADAPVLSWRDDAHCPAPARLADSVRELVGEGRHDDVQLALRVTSQANAEAGSVELSLLASTGGERFHRVLVAESCAAAQEAALLLVALALSPTRVPDEDAPAEPAPAESQRPRSISAGLFVAALADLGTLPGVAGGFALGGLLRSERLVFWLDAHTLLARETDRKSGAAARVDVWGGSLGGALALGQGRLRVGPSAALELGYLRAQGAGTNDARTTGSLWAAGYLGALLELPAGERTSLRGQLEGGVPFRRPAIAVQNGPTLYEPWPLVLRLTISIAVRFGSKG